MAKRFVIYLVLLNSVLFAQSSLREISGTVKTGTGALPLTNIFLYKAGIRIAACLSNNKGYYEFKKLMPDSTYRVLMEKRSFDRVEVVDLWVLADQVTSCDQALPASKGKKKTVHKRWIKPWIQPTNDSR